MPFCEQHHVILAPGVYASKHLLRFTHSKSSGPGGQHVNKRNTRITLTVLLEDLGQVLPQDVLNRLMRLAGRYAIADKLVFHSDNSRSPLANKRACITHLRKLIVQAQLKPKKRRPTRPTKASKERRLKNKTKQGQTKRWRTRLPDEND